MERKPIIDLNSGEEVVLLGTSGEGHSRWLEHILIEKGLTLNDLVVIDYGTFEDRNKLIEMFKDSDNKLILIEDINLIVDQISVLASLGVDNSKVIIDSLPLPKKNEASKPAVDTLHPFKKFMGKPNWKK